LKHISSADNGLFKELKSALEPKGIKKFGRFIVSGRKVVDEILADGKIEVEFILAQEEMQLPSSKEKFAMLTKPLFQELDIFGTKAPLLALKTPKLPEWKQQDKTEGLEILCALGEPSNLGALLRSAAAFGASKIVLLKESATPFHPKSVRSASGQLLKVALLTGPSIKDLSGEGVFALDMKGEDLAKFKWPKNARLLLGDEGPGDPQLAGIKKLKIPMSSGVESLNAAVAASIALYSYSANKL
jgi:RNA methyltransferase, TrmH family